MSAKHLNGRQSLEASEAPEVYKQVNWECRNYLLIQQKDNENSLADSMKSNPKAFHKYIRGKKIAPPSIGPLKLGGVLVSDDASMSEIFVQSFSSVFVTNDPMPFPHQVGDNEIYEVPVTLDHISSLLSSLNVSSRA